MSTGVSIQRPRRSWFTLFLLFGLLLLFRLDEHATAGDTASPQLPVLPARVLVVMNARDPGSREVADYYAAKRHIPAANILRIDCPVTDEWTYDGYRAGLEAFVRQKAQANPQIDYVVLTRGIPFRLSDLGHDGGLSIDSYLSTCLMSSRPGMHAPNPYFRQHGRFTRNGCNGLLLVTRLDGPTVADAKALVDSARDAKPVKGPFYLRDSFAMGMKAARDLLTERGFQVEWIEGFNNPKYPLYQGSGGPFMAHWGAGPHDTQYSPEEYAAIRFLPGALGDLTWSASAAGLRDPKSLGNIAVMTHQGAAGAQGYVSEPYADTISLPEIVLDRYTRGYNLAESFAMGERYVNWKQLVLGDPLCAPYAASAQNANGGRK